MSASRWVHLNVATILKGTDSAFLLRLAESHHQEGHEDGDEDYWIPKSQIADPRDYDVGDTDCTVSVTEWIAKQKGIEA